MIKLPKHNGDKVEIVGHGGARGCIRRYQAGVYSFDDYGNHYRNRWGNSAQIREDAEYFVAYGCLPPPSGDRW